MTFNEARKILGLGPNEDPRPLLDEFQNARERIAEMVRSAPNENLAARYQQGLIEFDRALAATHEYLQALGLEAKPGELAQPAAVPAPEEPQAKEEPAPTTAEPSSKGGLWLLLVLILAALAGGGWYLYQQQINDPVRVAARIAELEKEGARLVENRSWSEAAKTYGEIEALQPGSEIAVRGMRSIEAGMAEEQSQYTGYWLGQAISELESGRLDAAKAAAERVLEKFAGDTEATALLARIAEAKSGRFREDTITKIQSHLAAKDWEQAEQTIQLLLNNDPADPAVEGLRADIAAGREKLANDKKRAAELHDQAAALDDGKFNQQALDLLQEAAALDPENPDVAALLARVSSYTRSIKVPGDFDTLQAALDAARDRDLVKLGPGTWTGPFFIRTAVTLSAERAEDTLIECAPDAGSPLTISASANGARISNVTLRHSSFAVGDERFAAATVDGGEATFNNCLLKEAAGHGLAIVHGGKAVASRCRFLTNGWDGASSKGAGSSLEARDCIANENLLHGFECWEGASISLAQCRAKDNARNGIHIDALGASVTIEGNTLEANREFGLVATSSGQGSITKNTATGNLLGGFVLKAACRAAFEGNAATKNQGPGIICEAGFAYREDTQNTASQNTGQDTMLGTHLAAEPSEE